MANIPSSETPTVLSLPEAQEYLLTGRKIVYVHDSLMATLKSYFTTVASKRSPSVYNRDDFRPGLVRTTFTELEQALGKMVVYDTIVTPATISLM